MPLVIYGTGPTTLATGGVSGVTSTGISNQISTIQGIFAAAVTETAFPFTVDVSNYLTNTAGFIETISDVSAVLSLASTGAPISNTWQTSITINGTYITVLMDISKLQIGQFYQLAILFTASSIKKSLCVSILEVVT